MQQFNTPLMKQYLSIKEKYPGCIIFFRLGDFYEKFMEDAHIGAQVLDITLTSRPEGKDGRVPMAGVPYHAVDNYLSRMVKAGYKVAICEQLTEPDKKGIVERDVVRVVTPGTLIDEKALEKKENNYLVSFCFDDSNISICFADLSTGEVQVIQKMYTDFAQTLSNELAKINPAECILKDEDYNNFDILRVLSQEKNLNVYPFLNWEVYSRNSTEFLKSHFNIKTLDPFGIEDKPQAKEAAAALIGYLKETQKGAISHLKKISLFQPEEFVALDRSTLINLELFSTIREHDTKGSLLSFLDQTKTAMGGRLLRSFLTKPLTSASELINRYEAVESLLNNYSTQQNILTLLEEVPDIERIVSRLSVGIGNARDLNNLKQSLKVVLQIKTLLASLQSALLSNLSNRIIPDIQDLIFAIEETIVDEPSIGLKEGGLIREGINTKLDDLRKTVGGGKDWVLNLETLERQRTGIASLKVRFNQVFGYYIEVSKSNVHLVPADYIRKQTLVNGERYITPELKIKEELILSAEAEINDLEYEIFQKLLARIMQKVEAIQNASSAIAFVDVLSSYAYLSQKKNLTRPKIIFSGEIIIKGGRHPVVESLLTDAPFVPNNVELNSSDHQLLLITGPNMAGKSVYIRQLAVIVLLAQIGCFVPADAAWITLVDKIFVRSGASDVITSGLSTFMVEMMETAHILNHATSNSLIVMDEIGRGTSTYDGISIAWAVAEYLVTSKTANPKTLFATHYHELQSLEQKYPKKIKNYHMAVDSSKGDPIFLHTIMSGAASHSFGVAVAKLAGIPDTVIEKANIILSNLETRDLQKNEQILKTEKQEKPKDQSCLTCQKIKSLDTNNLTPIDALNLLAELKKDL